MPHAITQFTNQNTLMIQGCTSDAGKSVMVAGLCRLIARQDIRVAPFKPQNMALNSAVTIDGGEIGRAQAVQAQACYLDPHTDMNPILLKPTSDVGAQVIVHGKVMSAMQATQYHDYKKVAMQAVLDSHQRLKKQYSKIIVEGAGSPAEINLRDNDIANMGFAEAVDCPVVLIADIDRGGVFAHLVGTLALLSPSEQDRVTGFIINQFRGDISLLKSGLEWLEKRTNKPVLGVIPYIENFFLDAEDAIAPQQVTPKQIDQQSSATLNVIVPVLSRISNHTDFDALRLHPQVNLKFVPLDNASHSCFKADLIILPGSKNVLADLTLLKNAGWQDHLIKHLRYGGKIIGVCGGYQMLGDELLDPNQIETDLESAAGFGLLATKTTLMPEKQLKRANGKLIGAQFENTEIHGYEIHCGITDRNPKFTKPLIEFNTTEKNTSSLATDPSNSSINYDGGINQDNNVLGTYLHGLFDHPASCNTLLNWAGLKTNDAVDLNTVREKQLDRLADCLEQHLDADWLTSLKDTQQSYQTEIK